MLENYSSNMLQSYQEIFASISNEYYFVSNSREDFIAFARENSSAINAISQSENTLTSAMCNTPESADKNPIVISDSSGRCYYVDKTDGTSRINWRETLRDEKFGLNNRGRALLSVISRTGNSLSGAKVYISESGTPMTRYLSANQSTLFESEYLGTGIVSGELKGGVRHEDLTDMSFKDNYFDIIISQDVLEHIPNYHAALREIYRTLKPNGYTFMTAPFRPEPTTLVRAIVNTNGEILHKEKPEFHGDPRNPQGGILCFYHFGYDLLHSLSAIGFRRHEIHWLWSWSKLNLGGLQPIIVAQR